MAVKKTPSYDEAIGQIEVILEQIEEGNMEIDELSVRLKEVSRLIGICKGKIEQTEHEISNILKNIENENK